MRKIIVIITIPFLTSCSLWVDKEDSYIAQTIPSQTSQDALQKSIEQGSEIYSDFCMQCHMTNGEGLENSFPPLAKSDYLLNNREGSIKAIKYGQKGEIIVNNKKYNSIMAPLGLEDDEIADVMNYILNSWGNSDKTMVTKEEVASIKK